jgi:fumarate reductase subunit C
MSTPVTRVPSYQRRMGVFWWVHKRSYFLFVMRELSSLFVAWFVVYLLMFIAAVGGGEAKYDAFLDRASSPLFLVGTAVALAFLVLHTITWFALTPQAMVLNLGGRRVPGALIIVAQYVGLAAVSAFVFWLVVLA